MSAVKHQVKTTTTNNISYLKGELKTNYTGQFNIVSSIVMEVIQFIKTRSNHILERTGSEQRVQINS